MDQSGSSFDSYTAETAGKCATNELLFWFLPASGVFADVQLSADRVLSICVLNPPHFPSVPKEHFLDFFDTKNGKPEACSQNCAVERILHFLTTALSDTSLSVFFFFFLADSG